MTRSLVEATDLDGVRERRGAAHGAVLAAAWLGVAALVALGVLLDPDPRGWGTHEQLGFPPCLPMLLWKVPCPGCGVTTSVVLATHGELAASFAAQPFGLALALVPPLAAGWATWVHLRGRDLAHELERIRIDRWVLIGVVLLLASWAYKIAVVRAGAGS